MSTTINSERNSYVLKKDDVADAVQESYTDSPRTTSSPSSLCL